MKNYNPLPGYSICELIKPDNKKFGVEVPEKLPSLYAKVIRTKARTKDFLPWNPRIKVGDTLLISNSNVRYFKDDGRDLIAVHYKDVSVKW